MQNKEIRLASRPVGMPTLDNFDFVNTETSALQDDEVLLRSLYISVDPYLRGRMREGKSYITPFDIGQVIESGVVGEVVESRSPNFKPGDVVSGQLGWRLYNVAKAGSLMRTIPGVTPSSALGVLGVPGLTAYFGLLDIGRPHKNETVVVSGAAGAVGMTVCQIAKLKGCRVVATAGGQTKVEYLRKQLGVDEAIDYKATENMVQALSAACPSGIDIYFDNVGGAVSDAVLTLLNEGARIVICGQISIYNSDKPPIGLKPDAFLLVKKAMMKGFIITQYFSRFAEGVTQLTQWFNSGQLKHAETIVEGFENTPVAFIGLFKGENLGKQIVKVG